MGRGTGEGVGGRGQVWLWQQSSHNNEQRALGNIWSIVSLTNCTTQSQSQSSSPSQSQQLIFINAMRSMRFATLPLPPLTPLLRLEVVLRVLGTLHSCDGVCHWLFPKVQTKWLYLPIVPTVGVCSAACAKVAGRGVCGGGGRYLCVRVVY